MIEVVLGVLGGGIAYVLGWWTCWTWYDHDHEETFWVALKRVFRGSGKL